MNLLLFGFENIGLNQSCGRGRDLRDRDSDMDGRDQDLN